MPGKLRWTGTLAAAMLTAAPAAGQAPLPSVPALSDTVNCTYDMLTAEDREIALLLFERGVIAATPRTVSANLAVIDRLVGEASDKCALAGRWPRVRTAAASTYAVNALMGEGVSQALTSKGRSLAPIANYFAAHRAELSAAGGLSAAAAERFIADLVARGWDQPGAGTLGLAVFYLEALVTAQTTASAFAAAPAHRAPPNPALRPGPRRPAARARTTARDKL